MRGLSVLAGLLLAAFSAAGLWVDVDNNWSYGSTVSHEAAIVLAAAAIGVAAFPAVAAVRGWSALLAAGTAVCLVLTVGAAFLAYTAKQGETADARRGTAEAYRSAKQDEQDARAQETAARAEAAAIAELVSAAELELLAERARKTADEAAERAKVQGVLCIQVTRCRQADEALAAITQRLGRAKAKAAALRRADQARGRMEQAQDRAKAGTPTSAPLSAMWIAAQGGWKAEEVDASMNVGLAVMMILLTQILAWCAHPAVKCIIWGLERPAATTAPASAQVAEPATMPVAERQPKAAPRPRQRAARTAPAAVVEQVQAWADASLMARSGGVLPAGEVFATFQAETATDISQAAFGAAMVDAGFSKAKRGGKVVYTGMAFKQVLRLAAGA
jgi:hypothetical protein